ncbi:MAG TPA: hypothetical protein VNT00_01665 [Eoetvoesiella sp.]|uniref:hypothetical protein n=1 Tax=Eoetvoesiella sp. TaxID=1966355 RepID=UPI002C636528|nr:hypothetical protein [Eoetvoesiella sp.]HWK60101.1 hypothetical protein [Eoetvoesiella sp.]
MNNSRIRRTRRRGAGRLNTHARGHGESGQALLEGMAVMLALLSLWIGSAWLLRFQDMALQASHASRYAAFSLARHPDYRPAGVVRQSFFMGPGRQWRDRRGHEILSASRSEVTLQVVRDAQLSSKAQPGGDHADARRLRREWRLEDPGIFSAHVIAAPQAVGAADSLPDASFGAGLRQFDAYYPRLARHTAILSGAGHASGDRDTQARVGQSALAWGDATAASSALGRQIAAALVGVEGAWKRPAPVFDWLGAWQGMVPEQHFSAGTGGLP